MKKIWSHYKQTIILIWALLIGTIVGLVFKEKAAVLSPLGDLFMHMMFVIIIPLIFLTITTSIAKIKQPKRLGKVLFTIIGVFLATSLVAVMVGIGSTYATKLVHSEDTATILEYAGESENEETIELNLLERTISAISVNDFHLLLSKDNILALVIVSLLVGLAIYKLKEEAEPFYRFLESANKVVLKLLDFVMLYAPIGLGCYFASLIGTFGASIAVGYAKTFIIYLSLSIVFYIVVYSFYAFVAAGRKGVFSFWKNNIPALVTSISTCSSAASIPVNIKCAKNIGVSDDIAETTIPLGTSFHKDGSIIGSVFKVMFLVYLFGTHPSIWTVIGVSLVANLLITAVPIGGGTISEMMIISMMGFPVATLPILTIIATIIDPPATMLNVVGDTSSSMLVARIVDGKHWMQKSTKKKIKSKKISNKELTI